MAKNSYLAFAVAFGAWLLFIASFMFPAFYLRGEGNEVWGLYLLLAGWMGCLGSPGSLAWLANPCFVLAGIGM